MFQSTYDYIKAHPFVFPVPKCHDPQKGYWLVKCTAVSIVAGIIEYRCVCENWLNYTFTHPVPHHPAALYESVYLSITETIIQRRLRYLCAVL